MTEPTRITGRSGEPVPPEDRTAFFVPLSNGSIPLHDGSTWTYSTMRPWRMLADEPGENGKQDRRRQR